MFYYIVMTNSYCCKTFLINKGHSSICIIQSIKIPNRIRQLSLPTSPTDPLVGIVGENFNNLQIINLI